jgi:hypothetical protein
VIERPPIGNRCSLPVMRRLIPFALGSAIVVLGGAFVLGHGTASRSPAIKHSCSAADRQFLQTVSSNMTQLSFWSDQLSSGGTAPSVVIKQANAEAAQIAATRPSDPTFHRAQGMLRIMLTEYGRAIQAKAHGHSGGRHMGLSWQFAYDVHDLLAGAQPQLAPLGCDPAPLFATT